MRLETHESETNGIYLETQLVFIDYDKLFSCIQRRNFWSTVETQIINKYENPVI